MDISVILATYKRPQILSKTLESFCALKTDGLEWEVIVVDNAGDPDSQRTVEGFQRRLPLRFFVEKTPGKNNALNHGLKKARGELFVFTDDYIVNFHFYCLFAINIIHYCGFSSFSNLQPAELFKQSLLNSGTTRNPYLKTRNP